MKKNLTSDVNLTFNNKHAYFIVPLVLLLVDYVAIIAAENLALILRNYLVGDGGVYVYISWLNWHVIFPVCYILFLHSRGLYRNKMQFWRTLSGIFAASSYALITIIILLYVAYIAGGTSRLFVLLMGVTATMLLVLFRYFVKKILDKFELLQLPILIMGAGKTAELVLDNISKDSGLNYKIVGYLEDGTPNKNIAKRYNHCGGFADAERVIAETGVKHVLVIAPGLTDRETQSIVYRIQPLVKAIAFIPDLGTIPLGNFEVTNLVDGHVIMFQLHNNLAVWYNKVIKKVFDFVLTLVGTICISPILLFIALWIYHDSPGPVIFKHMRVGKNGKLFPCYKFRSMCVDAQEKLEELLANDPEARAEWEKDFKLKNDPRVTQSGAFLRKTSLDELPQIFNVLKGEMSLVGPRPIITDEICRYGEYINDYYMVSPGITGMWQTSGRSDVDYDERVQMDTWYVRNWNMWFDVVLLYRTFTVVASKKGAY